MFRSPNVWWEHHEAPVLKSLLHISKDEQKKRLKERIRDPEKRWKFKEGDREDRKYWKPHLRAFNDMLRPTCREHAPWVCRAYQALLPAFGTLRPFVQFSSEAWCIGGYSLVSVACWSAGYC